VRFYRICEGVKDYGKYIPETDNIFNHIKQDKPFYQSIYLYSEDQVKKAKEQIEIEKNGKKYKRDRGISGITDVVTKKLVFDFDSKDIEESKQDAIEIVNRLTNQGFKEEDLGIFFSGGKGFHIEVETDTLLTPFEAKSIATSLAKDLKTFDSVVYNASRVFRIPYTRHNSGYYKTRLTFDELENNSVQEVLNIAKEAYEPEGLQEVHLPASLLSLAKKKEETKVHDIPPRSHEELDLSKKPSDLSNWKYALSQGFYQQGSKHNALVILAATYKGMGKTQDEAYYLLKASAQLQANRFGEERVEKERMWDIISHVYSKLWEGGTYAEDNFPQAIVDYLTECEIPRFNDVEIDEDLVVDVDQGFDNFYDYATKIDENRLNFGIDSLDRLLKPQKGHLIGLLAGPGIGKTSMALELLSNTSKEGCQSFFGSYDMNSSILFQKLLQRETRLTDDEIYDIYRNNDQEQIGNFKQILKKHYSNVTFCFKVGQTIKDLKRTIAQREQVLGEKIGLVVVDYIELILSEKSDATQASAEAAQGLREIANSGKVVVVLLQPNKMSSKADEAPKTYNAAKGSSAIAQAVTSMMGCFRPGYDPEDPTMDKFFGVAILKNRMGPLGTCYFNWHGPTGRITEMEDIERQELDQYLKWKADNKQDIDGGL
jgi:hypothetical protein